jgi:putative endonuclease
MWFVYVLLCQDLSFYIGISTDPEKRFLLHKLGKGAKYTRSHKPIRIILIEKYDTKSEALKREFIIKKLTRKQKKLLLEKKSL